jgi:hypothetical protein
MSLDLSCSRMSTDLSHVRDFHFSRLLEEAARGAGVGHAFHDVNFRILDEEGRLAGQVRAHKMVLSLVSEMFRAQFTGSFAELSPQEEKGVTQAGLEKTRDLKKTQPSGFFGFFLVFLGYLGFLGFFAQKRGF